MRAMLQRIGRLARQGAFAGVVLLPAAFFFHTHLTKSFPAKDASLAEAPAQVRLWFSTKPEAKLTSITLLAADSSKIAMGPVAATDDTLSVAAAVQGQLAPGAYTVVWKTAAKDGHVVRGRYRFRYGAGAPAAPAASSSDGHSHSSH